MCLEIKKDICLRAFNTFGLSAKARFYTCVQTVKQLKKALLFAQEQQIQHLILGSGSNIILPDYINALVIIMQIKGRSIIHQDEHSITVQANAGENWHHFVNWTLEQKAFGLENLSLIPGKVGAAPIQNIGAYGIEIKDYFYSLTALNIKTGQEQHFNNTHCQFDYRDSVFKHQLKKQFIILSVIFRLNKQFTPNLNHEKLREILLQKYSQNSFTAIDMSQTICDIRKNKLPDPKIIGNAGSFFKNPIIDHQQFLTLKKRFPDIIAYPFELKWKIAAGWMIEKSELKEYQTKTVSVYKKQALILINQGSATKDDVLDFAQFIKSKVYLLFQITLEIEPDII